MLQSPDVKQYDLYLDEPRLKMSFAGRAVVRISSYIGALVLVAADATFLISPLIWIRVVGGCILIFLVDRVVHWGEGDKPIFELPGSGRVNVSGCIAPKSYKVIERAFDRSSIKKTDFFLEAAKELLDFPQISEGLRRLDVKPEEFRQKIEELLPETVSKESPSKEERFGGAEVLARSAFLEAVQAGHRFIQPSDLFGALRSAKDDATNRLFDLFSIEAGDLSRALVFSALSKSMSRLPGNLAGFVVHAPRIRHRIMNRAWTSRPTPTLDKYATDLTDLARERQVGFLIGHDQEFERLIDTLARPSSPNALLVGEAGIGKNSIIEHLALTLIKDDIPKALFDKRLVSLELESLVAGAPQEELTARLKKIVEEIEVADNIIIYIPNIHNLVRTSGTAYLSAADALMPIIMNNEFPIVGTSSPREFKEFLEPRSDFTGAFEMIRVNEVTEAEAEKILSYEGLILERKYGITISFGAVKRAVILAKKYFHNKFLPSSAEELLKSAAVDAERRGEKTLGPDRVVAIAEAKVNIPMHEAGDTEAKQLLDLENTIHERIIGQDEAVKAVADSLREYRSGLSRPGGPIASFLFVGPTGVGKTELAKILAKIQFGSEKLMVRFDMTEYQDKQSFLRFIGSPDGKTSGALTDAILEKPYSLVLLDEFEKAYPDILNLFLQVLDDGRLTDNLGRVVDFTNTIIIATSNAHSDIINESLNQGQSMMQIADYLKKKLTDVFKPELLNRFSRVVIFRNLMPSELEKIVALNLFDIAQTLEKQGIKMRFDDSVVKQFVKLGYDPAFGARPLRRVIDEKLRAPLAKRILEKKVGKGNQLDLVMNGDDLDFVTPEKG